MSDTAMTESVYDSLKPVVQGVGGGDSDAARLLYDRMKIVLEDHLRRNRLIGEHLRPDVCTTEIAHFALAELFRALVDGRFTYQGRRPLLAWLIKVMLHSIADFSKVPRELALPDDEIVANKSAAEQMVDLRDELEDATLGFDDRAREVFQLWLAGYSQREIATRLDCSRRRVYRILQLIALRLHERLLGGERVGEPS